MDATKLTAIFSSFSANILMPFAKILPPPSHHLPRSLIVTACLHNLAISLNVPIPEDDLEMPNFPPLIHNTANVADHARRNAIVVNYFVF
jgi:hypothetical protein